MQDAFASRSSAGRATAPPANPGALDHHDGAEPRDRPAPPRADAARARRELLAGASRTDGARRTTDAIPDERLGLIFACCHPALALEARVALTLRAVGGLTTDGDRARVPRPRGDDGAAARAREAEDPRRRHPVPRAARPPAAGAARRGAGRRSTSIFNEGYGAAGAARASSATRRSGWRSSLRVLMPDEPEALGLLALMLLHDSRRGRARRRRRRARAARGAGPLALGPRRDRRGPARARPRAARCGGRGRTSSRPRSRRCTPQRGDRTGRDRRALRPARRARTRRPSSS